jgi:Major Facilitator Superfamily
VARVIQGAGGAIFPLSFSIIRDEFPAERVPVGIAMISAILGIGGGLGIVLAGPIVQHLSYHWLFWLPLIAVVAAAVGTQLFVPESPVRSPGRIDWTGAALLAGWLVALLLPISEGETWGWTSTRTLGLFAIAAVLAAVWVWVESRTAAALVDMGMMRMRAVWTTNLAALVFRLRDVLIVRARARVRRAAEVDRVRLRSVGHAGRAVHGPGDGRDAHRRPGFGPPFDDRRVEGPAHARVADLVHRVQRAGLRARVELGDLRRDARAGDLGSASRSPRWRT